MPKKQEVFEIDGFQYKVTHLGGDTGSKVLFRLTRAAVGVMSGLATGNLGAVLTSLSPADFDWVRDTLIPTTSVGVRDEASGQVNWHKLSADFAEHFAGPDGQLRLFEWMKCALEANFGPLPVALGRVIRGFQRGSESDSKPPKESTGSAGDSSSAPG